MNEALKKEIQSIYEQYASEIGEKDTSSSKCDQLSIDYDGKIFSKMKRPIMSTIIRVIKSIDLNSSILSDLERLRDQEEEMSGPEAEMRFLIKKCLKEYDKEHIGATGKPVSFYRYVLSQFESYYKRVAQYNKYDRLKELEWVQDDRQEIRIDLEARVPNGKKKFTTVVRKIERLKEELDAMPSDLREDEIVSRLVSKSRGYTERQIRELLDIINRPNLKSGGFKEEVLCKDQSLYQKKDIRDDELKVLMRIIMEFLGNCEPEERYILENYADNKEKIRIGAATYAYMDIFIAAFEKDPVSRQAVIEGLFNEFGVKWDDENIKRRYRRLLHKLNIKLRKINI